MSRSPDRILQVASPLDRALLEICSKALDEDIVQTALVSEGPFGASQFTSAEELRRRPVSDARVISSVVFRHLDHSLCKFSRVRTISSNGGYSTEPSRVYAEYYFEDLERSVQHHETREELKARQKLLWALVSKSVASDTIESSRASEHITDVLAAHVEALAGESARIASRLAEAELESDRRTQERLHALDEHADAAERIRQASHNRRIEELKLRENDLETKSALLDMRSARDARRKIREDLTSTLKTRLVKPEASIGARWNRYLVVGISVVILILSAASAAVSIPALEEVSVDANATQAVLVYGRFFGSTAAFVAFSFYLLGYLKRLEAEDTRYERDLERFSLDIDRASWVIETVMDFDSEGKERSVPDKWLENATASLFGSSTKESSEDENALEALGKLLGTGAKLRIGTDGAEMTIEPPSAKKIAKSAD